MVVGVVLFFLQIQFTRSILFSSLVRPYRGAMMSLQGEKDEDVDVAADPDT